jgi:hypothetical protein
MKRLLIVLCTTAILFSAVNLRGEEYNPGKSWLNWSEGEHLIWLWGFTKGQELILEELQIKSTKNLKYFISFDDAEAISKIMSQYYKDVANTYIPWKYIATVAKKKLEGVPAAKIEVELELLRQYAAYERSKKKDK